MNLGTLNAATRSLAENRTGMERVRSRMLAILENTLVIVAMADRTGALFYANPAALMALGMGAYDDISGVTLIEFVAPDAVSRVIEEAIPAATRNGVWSGDSVLLDGDGHQIDVALMITAHYGNDREYEGLSFLAQNKTAWRRTGEAVRDSRNELLRLSAQHLTILESERRRIAADLHDGLGQSLSLVTSSIDNVVSLLATGDSKNAAERLDQLKSKLKDVLDEVRRIAMNLRPAMLDNLGILATLSWYFRELELAWPSIKLEREIKVEEADVPECVKTPIFRIVQEAGSNVIKHAGADRIKVRLCKERGVLELSVEDNGQGFDAAGVPVLGELDKGLGLQTMRERAELSCGICEIKSERGKGTQVRVAWPLSLEKIGLDRATSLGPQIQALDKLALIESGTPDGMALLHHLSVCVACIRNINNDW